jgi:hypothetical protein
MWPFSKNNRVFPRLATRNVEIDTAFTTDEKGLIIDAIGEWNKESKGLVLFRIVNMCLKSIGKDKSANDVVVVKVLSSDEAIKSIEKNLNKKAVGFAQFSTKPMMAFIVCDKIYSKKDFKNVVIHELGHLIRLPHSFSNKSIMYSRVVDDMKIRRQDVNDLIYAYVKALNWQSYPWAWHPRSPVPQP